jgi:gephyrin
MGDATKLRAAIIIVSETASKDPSTDKCIPVLREVFSNEGAGRFDTDDTVFVPDDVLQIQRAITQRTDGDDFANLIVTSGGTGFTQKDVTPEVCWFALNFSSAFHLEPLALLCAGMHFQYDYVLAESN